MRNRPIPSLALCTLLALSGGPAWAGRLVAETNRTRLAPDETLTLRLSADGDLSGNPDFGALKKDFEILGQSTGTSMTIVNGSSSHTREWTLELAPRHPGHLSIPAIRLDGELTEPILVEVAEVNGAAVAKAPKPIFLDSRVDAKSPYVQQGFVYRVRVLYREQPRRASLSEPQVEGATVEQLGEDQNYAEMVDGERYNVIERRYRIVPQRSGPLAIGGPRLEAVIPDERPGVRRSPFADIEQAFGGSAVFQGFPSLGDLGGGRRVVERGPDLKVEVRSQPAGSGSFWLPAQSVQLADEWSPSPPRFRVGEPVTRTLAITAQGASAAQLPTLDMGSPEGAKVYPEPPKVEDLPGSASPTALKTVKIAVVPTRAGSLTLPEIRLAWWDTAADRARVALIPQRTVQVEPAADGATSVEPQPQVQTQADVQPRMPAPAPAAGADAGAAGSAPAGGATGPAASGLLARLADAGVWPALALLLALGWLATLIRQRRERRRDPEAQQRSLDGSGARRRAESLRSARAAVRQACLADDAHAVRSALLAWGRAQWRGEPPQGLGELAERLNGQPAASLLAAIDRANYAGGAAPWDGRAAWAGLEPLLVAAEREGAVASAGPLPELYPRMRPYRPFAART